MTYKNARGPGGEETKNVKIIDAIRSCGKDIDKLHKLVTKSKFCMDWDAQGTVGILTRGITIKLNALRVVDMAQHDDLAGLTKEMESLYAKFDKALSPLKIDLEVKGNLNTGDSFENSERQALKEVAKAWAERERKRQALEE